MVHDSRTQAREFNKNKIINTLYTSYAYSPEKVEMQNREDKTLIYNGFKTQKNKYEVPINYEEKQEKIQKRDELRKEIRRVLEMKRLAKLRENQREVENFL